MKMVSGQRTLGLALEHTQSHCLKMYLFGTSFGENSMVFRLIIINQTPQKQLKKDKK